MWERHNWTEVDGLDISNIGLPDTGSVNETFTIFCQIIGKINTTLHENLGFS